MAAWIFSPHVSGGGTWSLDTGDPQRQCRISIFRNELGIWCGETVIVVNDAVRAKAFSGGAGETGLDYCLARVRELVAANELPELDLQSAQAELLNRT